MKVALLVELMVALLDNCLVEMTVHLTVDSLAAMKVEWLVVM